MIDPLYYDNRTSKVPTQFWFWTTEKEYGGLRGEQSVETYEQETVRQFMKMQSARFNLSEDLTERAARGLAVSRGREISDVVLISSVD
jgi:hypothetical protein